MDGACPNNLRRCLTLNTPSDFQAGRKRSWPDDPSPAPRRWADVARLIKSISSNTNVSTLWVAGRELKSPLAATENYSVAGSDHEHRRLAERLMFFRQGEFVPAVEYLRATRVRTKLMHAMEERMAAVNLYVSSGQDMAITNLTGHLSVVFPMGFRDRDGRAMPGSVILTGRLYDESTLLAVARAFEHATGDHLKRPPIERYLAAGG